MGFPNLTKAISLKINETISTQGELYGRDTTDRHVPHEIPCGIVRGMTMGKRFQFFITLFSAGVLILFIMFVVNQTTIVVTAARSIHPVFGDIILYVLLTVYALLVIIPFYMLCKLPRALPPPPGQDVKAITAYIKRLTTRLHGNKFLDRRPYETLDDLRNAFKDLERKSDAIITDAASTVFIGTAISQSGRLDGILVLLTQCRMVWDIATVYNQRPSPLEFVRLYQNVAVTTFVASQIDDIDIAERVGPVVTELTGVSVTGVIPGLSGITGTITNSLMDGSANAFLTLRVGAITKKYCDPLSDHDKSRIRKAASMEAASLLGSIVYSCSGKVVSEVKRGIGTASKKAGNALWQKVKGKKSQYETPDTENEEA